MALVDYDSDSNGSATDAAAGAVSPPPPSKRIKTDTSGSHVVEQKQGVQVEKHASPAAAAEKSSLPPLPASFHDLYAHTVRTANVDDPNLHQGRKRLIPHVAGNWPSHLYIEWHPIPVQHTILTSILDSTQSSLKSPSENDDPPQISSFLTSDLGAPLPLHVSLSRPLALTTATKDTFLSSLKDSIKHTNVVPFALRCKSLYWFRSPESERSFLVLGVESTATYSSKGNAELLALLKKCNNLVEQYNLPALYTSANLNEAENGDVSSAFHISVAWTFAPITEGMKLSAADAFSRYEKDIAQVRIQVDGIKAKIGNHVTHIPLLERGKRTAGGDDEKGKGLGLFGIF